MKLSKWAWGYVYWGTVWLLIGFLMAELLGYGGIAPWPTLSETVWHALGTYPWIKPYLFATLIFMFMHFFYHRPILVSLSFGLLVAFSAHLLDKSLP